MSDHSLKEVSVLTGTFAALTVAPENTRTGSDEPSAGKNLPQSEKVDVNALTKELNIAIQAIGRDLRFQVDLVRGTSVIQVLDSETGELIRQIPPEHAKTYVSDLGRVALRLYDNQV